jgi:hypothetical protein
MPGPEEPPKSRAVEDRDALFISQIRARPADCSNPGQLDLRTDPNGNCRIDFRGLAIMADTWLGDGLSAP